MAGSRSGRETDQGIAELKCLICEKPVERQKTFTCRRCRKSPFCFEHLDREYKTCLGCAAEERMNVYRALVGQERSLKGFFRFTQFVLFLAILFFTADKFYQEYIPEFLRGSVFFEYVFYLGGAAVTGMVLCYVLILSQRQKMKDVQEMIHRHKTDSRYTFR